MLSDKIVMHDYFKGSLKLCHLLKSSMTNIISIEISIMEFIYKKQNVKLWFIFTDYSKKFTLFSDWIVLFATWGVAPFCWNHISSRLLLFRKILIISSNRFTNTIFKFSKNISWNFPARNKIYIFWMTYPPI